MPMTYHVRTHAEADTEVFDTLPEALSYAADALERIADSWHDAITSNGEAAKAMSPGNADYIALSREHYAAAYRAFVRSETYGALARNAANVARQAELPRDDRAPLYQGDDGDTRLDLTAQHVMEVINRTGPDGFAVYPY